MEKIAVYRRVSSDKQVQTGESLEAQYSLAKQYTEKQEGFIELMDYCEPGISASKVHFTKRPELMRMLDDAKKGVFSTLLVFRRDRLDRSNDFHTIKYILIKAKVKIVYLDPNEINIEDDLYGNLIESVITSIAAIEPKLISARVKAVFREKTQKGLWVSGKPPFGLFHDKESAKLIAIPEEAKVVKKIFDYYTNKKMGYQRIALSLNEQNILFRNNLGIKKQWSTSNVRDIINNPIYKGYLRLVKDDGSVELIKCTVMDTPIIAPDQFNEAEKLKNSRKSSFVSPRERTTTFLLSNIFYCSCGRKMVSSDKSYYYTDKNGNRSYRKYTYYVCGLYSERMHLGVCDVKSINANLIHSMTLDKCCEMFQTGNFEKIQNKLIERQNLVISETKSNIKEITRRISELNRKIEVILENLESSTDVLFVEMYEKRLGQRVEELQKFQSELVQQKRYYNELKDKVWTLEEIREKLQGWSTEIYKVSPEVQRKMLLDVINKVQLDKDGNLLFELKVSLDNLDDITKEISAHNNSYVHLFPLITNLRKTCNRHY